MFYQIQTKIVKTKELEASKPYIATFSNKSQEYKHLIKEEHGGILQRFHQLHFCKAEVYDEAVIGSLAIPKRGKANQCLYLAFYVTPKGILLFDDTDFTNHILQKLETERSFETPSVGYAFYYFLELITEDDLLYMEELENKITDLEEKAMMQTEQIMNPNIMHFRKKSFVLYRYYSQMIHMSEKFLENENELLSEKQRKLFQIFKERCEQLLSEAAMLQEYARQVREVYQSQIDIKQNNIMRVLTVVTTVFMPLTLITGWYGMNFVNMLELKHPYGYPAICIISIVIVCVCIWIFKKKKFF